jgi:hypothetical protein
MSNPRKSIKPSTRDFHAAGSARNGMSWPATSSITIDCGSLSPVFRATEVAAGTPTAMVKPVSKTKAGTCQLGRMTQVKSHQTSVVANEAQVPGAQGICPIPKPVATSSAQLEVLAVAGCVVIEPGLQEEGMVSHRRSHYSSSEGGSGVESDMSRVGEEITYAPLAHLPKSISRQRSLQKGKSGSVFPTGFLQTGQSSWTTRLRAMVLRRFWPPDRSRGPC